MRLDSQAIFSDAQAITANCASTNVVQMAAGQLKEVAFGKPIPLLIQVVEEFNNLTSLKVGVQTCATDNGTWTTLEEATLNLADLKEGKKFPIVNVPAGNKGFMRLYYTIVGTAPTTGKITAGIVDAIGNSYEAM